MKVRPRRLRMVEVLCHCMPKYARPVVCSQIQVERRGNRKQREQSHFETGSNPGKVCEERREGQYDSIGRHVVPVFVDHLQRYERGLDSMPGEEPQNTQRGERVAL